MDSIHVSQATLRELCTGIQIGFGVPKEDASVVSDCLVDANLMGLDTHGVIRLKFYMDRIEAGGNNPTPAMRTLRDGPATAVLDADNALGPVGGKAAMDLAAAKAGTVGIGAVAIRNCNHYGPAGWYARMAAAQDMIGMSFSNVLASMAPTGGAQRQVGNNPYAFAFPAGDRPPVVVDGATSKSSWGKLMLCAQKNVPLPEGCYLDAQGNPTTKPADVMDGGSLLPFAAHKGYGLAVAAELLTGMLSGGALDHDIPHPYKKLDEPGANSFFMLAIKVEAFEDPDTFKARMDAYIDRIHATPPAEGVERIYLPGEMEAEAEEQRRSDGIPLTAVMAQELKDLAARAGAQCDLP